MAKSKTGTPNGFKISSVILTNETNKTPKSALKSPKIRSAVTLPESAGNQHSGIFGRGYEKRK